MLHVDQCQEQCVSMLGQTFAFHQRSADDVMSDAPYHTACIQELKLLKLGDETPIVSSLDRSGHLHLWRWDVAMMHEHNGSRYKHGWFT